MEPTALPTVILYAMFGLTDFALVAMMTFLSFMHLSSKFSDRRSLLVPYLMCIPYFLSCYFLKFGVHFILDDAINQNLLNVFLDFLDAFLIAYSFWKVTVGALNNFFLDMFDYHGIPQDKTRTMSICVVIILLFAQLYGYGALVTAFGNLVGIIITLTKITAVSIMYILVKR